MILTYVRSQAAELRGSYYLYQTLLLVVLPFIRRTKNSSQSIIIVFRVCPIERNSPSDQLHNILLTHVRILCKRLFVRTRTAMTSDVLFCLLHSVEGRAIFQSRWHLFFFYLFDHIRIFDWSDILLVFPRHYDTCKGKSSNIFLSVLNYVKLPARIYTLKCI